MIGNNQDDDFNSNVANSNGNNTHCTPGVIPPPHCHTSHTGSAANHAAPPTIGNNQDGDFNRCTTNTPPRTTLSHLNTTSSPAPHLQPGPTVVFSVALLRTLNVFSSTQHTRNRRTTTTLRNFKCYERFINASPMHVGNRQLIRPRLQHRLRMPITCQCDTTMPFSSRHAVCRPSASLAPTCSLA